MLARATTVNLPALDATAMSSRATYSFQLMSLELTLAHPSLRYPNSLS